MYSRWTSESPIGQESGILLSQKHVSWVEAHMLLVECMEIYIYIKSYTHILIGPYPWSIGGQMHGWHNQLKQRFASLWYQTNRFCVAMHLFSSRSQKTSWYGKISETLSFASCATFFILSTFCRHLGFTCLTEEDSKREGGSSFCFMQGVRCTLNRISRAKNLKIKLQISPYLACLKIITSCINFGLYQVLHRNPLPPSMLIDL